MDTLLLWSCVLPFLCTPSALSWTVTQKPRALSLMRVNSSAEINCSVSRPDPTGLRLRGRFHGDREVAYLSMEGGVVNKVNINPGFKGRMAVQPETHCCEFTWHLSLLGLDDTDSYYCSWEYLDISKGSVETLESNGTIIIVRERDPGERCKDGSTLELILIVLSVTGFTIIFFLFLGALLRICTRKKRHYNPASDRARVKCSRGRQRQSRQHHLCPNCNGRRPTVHLL